LEVSISLYFKNGYTTFLFYDFKIVQEKYNILHL